MNNRIPDPSGYGFLLFCLVSLTVVIGIIGVLYTSPMIKGQQQPAELAQ